ncbi:transient receptor potential cation channel subfamily M member 2-like [Patiria miniata]|uniref:Uncharacterized protein n=1 Tax=Patiria miniata TaxID=46514 RepID=A0A914BSF4_PATMI|nr:transient receptor potential cation channel subfamily M member 2-like [Patiria miniata]
MTDTKELVPLDLSMDSSTCSRGSQASLRHRQTRHIADWAACGFRSQASCEFGSIQFFKGAQKHKKNSKFLIVDTRESADPLLRVLLEKWQLDLPKLLIHLVGAKRQTGVEYSKMMGKTFSKELIDAIHHTDAWLLTNGLHHGITESVGKALVDATKIASTDQHQLVAIGMAPAIAITHIENLQQSVGGPVEYQMEILDGDSDTSTCLLDSSHTHFIIEQDRCQDGAVSEPLLAALIDKIAQSKIQQTNATVPVVYVLFGGDEDSLLAVHSAVVIRNIPVIIVAGSGGVADRLAAAVQSNYSTSAEEDNASKIQEIMHPSRAHLVTVYREDQGMDAALLMSLMNTNRGARGQNELLLAVIWNRIDLARKELAMNKNWIDQFQEIQLAESLQYALIHDQHKFVEFFLDRDCIDLQTFLTRERLIDLYSQVGARTLLWKLLIDERKANPISSKPDLKDVGNILKSLIGLNSFNPEYLRNDVEDTFSKPYHELLVWAVLQHRKNMAWVLWKHGGTSIGGALLASKLLKSMSRLVNEPGIADEMLQHGREFQDRAIKVMNCCYAENQHATWLLLTQVLPDWGNATCLEFAFAAKNKLFISQAAVQNLLQKLWMGRLAADTGLMAMWICTLIPFAALSLVKFTPSDKLAKPTVKVVPSSPNRGVYAVSGIPNNSYRYLDEADGQYKSLQRSLFPKLTPEALNQPSPIFWLTKLLLFFKAPVIGFSYHLISHLLFLLVFSYILLKDFTDHQSLLEIFLMIWVVTLIFEELREFLQEDYDSVRERLEAWLWGYWNLLDLVALVMFSVGMALRYTHGTLVGARIVLALDLIVFYLRILQFFSANKFLGPKLIMIVKMMVDIVTFICILFVFLVAYGVAFQSILYPNEQSSLEIVRGVLYQPYFQLYGELFLKDIHGDECERMTSDMMTTPASTPIACPQNSWFGTIVLAFYLFISNIMLLNLLIAMFNYTFSTVQDNTDTYWKFQRFQLVKEYYMRPVVAPPFIIVAHVYLVLRFLWRRFLSQNKQRDDSSVMRKHIYIKDQQLYSELSSWETVKGKDFLAAAEKQHDKDVLRRIKQTNKRLDEMSANSGAEDRGLMQRLDSMQTQVDRRLTAIETQMNGLEQLLRNVCGMHLSAGPSGALTADQHPAQQGI